MSAPLLLAERLRFAYSGRPVLRGAELRLWPADRVALLGSKCAGPRRSSGGRRRCAACWGDGGFEHLAARAREAAGG